MSGKHLQSFHYVSNGNCSIMQRYSSVKAMSSISPILHKWLRCRGINAHGHIFATILLKDIVGLCYHPVFNEEYVSLVVMIIFEAILKLLQICEWQ